jgi:hypothetical protein
MAAWDRLSSRSGRPTLEVISLVLPRKRLLARAWE